MVFPSLQNRWPFLILAFTLLAIHQFSPAQGVPIQSFSVSPDQSLNYPTSDFLYLPDEHTTIMPGWLPGLGPNGQRTPVYNFFVAMVNKVGTTTHGGAFVLQRTDLSTLELAPGYGDPEHGNAVLWAPHAGAGNCGYSGVTHFDEQYGAPGYVFQDPTLPDGNFVMIYEAEIHCPVSPGGMGTGWASIGVARSTDFGHTWPAPTASPGYENNWLDYGNGRYAGVTLPGTPLTTPYDHFYGDALPSAFVDDVHPENGYYVYVPYTFTGTPAANGDAHIHIARARLGGPGKLAFEKWYVDPVTKQGGWTEAGIGGNESGLLQMPSCAPTFANQVAQITYNEAYGAYMMTYACLELTKSGTSYTTTNISWYYTTATDLGKQDWSAPQEIAGSSYPVPYGTLPWEKADGGYPSLMSPGCTSGHIGNSGTAFFLKGDGLGQRIFASRTFTISGANPNPEACTSITGALENPQPGSFQSGIGLLSGWSCAGPSLGISIDGKAPLQAPYGSARADTASVCGAANTSTGFGLLINFNTLGAGVHSAQRYVNGVVQGIATPFTVNVPAGEFLTGASKQIAVPDFPAAGQVTTLVWQQAQQNFAIAGVAARPLDTMTVKAGPGAALENPQPGSFQSGIGLVSGWSCQGPTITVAIDGGAPLAVPYGSARADTASVCGATDTNTGFGLLINFNTLGAGTHNAQLYVDSVARGSPTPFTVTVPAGEFLSGVSQQVPVSDFPRTGATTTLIWQQSQQNFAIESVGP